MFRASNRAFSTTRPVMAAFGRKQKSSIAYKFSTLAVIGTVGGAGLWYYYKDSQSAIHQYLLLPVIRLLFDAETSHNLAIETMRYPSINPREKEGWDALCDPNRQLEVTLFKSTGRPITLRNPIGVAAGLDKDGKAIDSLFNLGFSYVEIGSITPLAQAGNPKPRFWRLPNDDAVINRYGFNSEGHLAVLGRLKQRLQRAIGKNVDVDALPHSLRQERALAINLGKNKTSTDEVQDYVTGVRNFGAYADVLVVNVSSPNTPGLRDLQSESRLTNLLTTVVGERDKLASNTQPPVVVKIAPDLTEPEIESIAAAVKKSKVDGVIVSNTTIERPQGLRASQQVVSQAGGLSGKPLKPYSLKALKTLRKHLGKDITIIGCGGISNGHDAVEFARAGADFVQLYTAFAYTGPAIAGQIKRTVLQELGDKKWSDIVGSDV